MIVDICKTLAQFGPRRFYVLNTGVSTNRPLEAAAQLLAGDGILLRYTVISKAIGKVEKEVSQQEGGSHADEIETSMMIFIDPASVDMTKAAKDFHVGEGKLTRIKGGEGTYSPTGIYGDATLATREKGEKVTAAFVDGVLNDIGELKSTQLPTLK